MQTKYKLKDYTFGQLKNDIIIPNFQRSLVWSKQQKEKFIQSALEGNPFGVLLLHDDVQSRKLVVIDGLQRFTTLKKYDEKPFEFLDIKSGNYPEIFEIKKLLIKEYPDENDDNVLNNVLESIRNVIENHDLKRTTKFAELVVDAIVYRYPHLHQSANELLINRKLYELWKKLEDKIIIDSLPIPSIIYQGDESELPAIFEKLNQGGTKLSKYEVFASSWNNIVLKGVDVDITKQVEERYQKIIEETDLQIDGYTEGSIVAKSEVTLYEFCLALGKVLKKGFGTILLNSRANDADVVDSIGFSTLITFLGKHLKHMSKLKDSINDKVKPVTLNKLKAIILNVFSDIQEMLHPYVGTFNKYVEAQVLSIAYTWFKINYDFDSNTLNVSEKVNKENYVNAFKKYMPYRFIYDIINSVWSGHGDNTLFEIIQSSLENNRYLQPIKKEFWGLMLNEWTLNQFKNPMKSFTAETKLFYSFILKYLGEDVRDEYIATHVIPKNMVESIPDFVPISPLGNIYFLPKAYRKDYKKEFLLKKFHREHINWYYPETNELQFILNNQLNATTYISFVERRNHDLITLFIESVPS